MVDRISLTIEPFVVECVARIVDAWARLADEQRLDAIAAATQAAPAIADEVTATLRAELLRPAVEQRHTPLEILAGAVETPTAILRSYAIPPVDRDPRDESIHPDDIYDLVPRRLADLGDPDLGPLQIAWGLAKHEAVRASRP
jgi:hypothetical protein